MYFRIEINDKLHSTSSQNNSSSLNPLLSWQWPWCQKLGDDSYLCLWSFYERCLRVSLLFCPFPRLFYFSVLSFLFFLFLEVHGSTSCPCFFTVVTQTKGQLPTTLYDRCQRFHKFLILYTLFNTLKKHLVKGRRFSPLQSLCDTTSSYCRSLISPKSWRTVTGRRDS